MVTLIKILLPLAENGTNYFLSGGKIVNWDETKLGPQPSMEYLQQKAIELAPQIAEMMKPKPTVEERLAALEAEIVKLKEAAK